MELSTLRILPFAILAFAPLQLYSQAYPAKAVRLVVPNPPGGSSDLLARLVAQKVGETLGQPMVVENRAGADSIIGAELVARSAPDGYTLLVGNASANVANLFLYKSLPYDPVKDFTPITGGGESVTCLVVSAALPVNSVKELIDYAKRNPGKLSYGSSGANGAYYMSGEAFKAATGTDIVHVPYKGLGPAMTGVVRGEIGVAFTAATVAIPQVRAGKVKMLAVLEGKRYSKLPDIPAAVEAVPGFRAAAIWNGFFGPASVPAPIVTRLNQELLKALHSPELIAKLDALEIIGGTPEEFAAYVKGQVEAFGRIVKLVGMQPQ